MNIPDRTGIENASQYLMILMKRNMDRALRVNSAEP